MILLSCAENNFKYSINPFKLELGKVMLLFLPKDIETDVKLCERSSVFSFHIHKYPYWVRFTLEKIQQEDIEIINSNMKYLHSFFSFGPNANYQFTKKTIKELSGWDIRLLNMFLKRVKGEDFFELNIAGLSISSILLMLEFVLAESKFLSSYLIIDSTGNYKNNPLIITEANYRDVYSQVYHKET